jgi:hypothetical protein
MQTFDISPVHVLKNRGASLIALGLAILLVAFCWPAAPVVSGMALIALGTTQEVVARFGSASRIRPLVAVHAVTYAWSLSARFVTPPWLGRVTGSAGCREVTCC